ncbi:hypothetical protein ACFOPX_08420 [Helicobacter baculiformis]|uniref:Mobilization protein n=1 Tax=Helicobacter baculiformis TaxID=427351 RepID=A0ABV7ZML8_9HELI|nr:hypothetical protein [Helicobacter baculiformis]
MSNLASIHFKKSISIQVVHNDRTLPPSYLLDESLRLGVECNRNAKEARALKAQMIEQAITNYTNLTKKKFQAKSYEWSAVVNLKEDSTMQDLERLADHFKSKYGFQCYQIAIHRDEGHTDEYGTTHINHHAHLEFVTLDELTGKSLFRSDLRTSKAFRQFQDEVATILQMQRGTDKRISKTKRIEPRAYAQLAEEAKAERKSLKDQFNKWAYKKIDEVNDLQNRLQQAEQENQDLKAKHLTEKQIRERLEQERKEWIAQKDHTAQEYKELRALANNYKLTNEQLENHIAELNQKHALAIQARDQNIQRLEQDKQDLEAQIQKLNAKHSLIRVVQKKDANGNPIPLLDPNGNQLHDRNGNYLWETEEVYLDQEQQKVIQAQQDIIQKLTQEIQDIKAKLQQYQAQNQAHQSQLTQPNSQSHNPQWDIIHKPKKGRGRY